jgi:2-polyprenyl-6-methoxyphenol hydroxylase-like FAD-dependent oxidoreductase
MIPFTYIRRNATNFQCTNPLIKRWISRQHSSITAPVVIIGGGPTGLLLSILLSQYNIPSTLIERRTPKEIHLHPQAHYINLRSMEILKHYVPYVYQNVLQDMPPVEDWEAFTFGHSVLGRQIARVLHPVRGIEVGQDGNGVLVAEESSSENTSSSSSSSIHALSNKTDPSIHTSKRCSVCNPSHLAQNKFSSLLLDEARRMKSLIDQQQTQSESHVQSQFDHEVNIFHGESVQYVKEHNSSKLIVQTDHRQIEAQYVVAAEGYNSKTRNDHGGILAGNPAMQHLMNVHFRTSELLSKRLMERKEAVGMLHFVFNSQIVGAFVCHNAEEGEWVLQVPYFPPFQEPKDFTLDRVREMVLAGLLGHNISESDKMQGIEVLSIKPWTMAATVAQSFFVGDSKRIILAGDAAHAFPPAGGFGMNTGFQDAHNLAWRLAIALKYGSISKENDEAILRPYEHERRPIASQNAALSVRNFNRTLEIAKACYLNADHPSLLKRIMEAPPMNFIPMAVRQKSFAAAVSTAMLPLTNLASAGNLYGKHVKRNVRKILESGGGLPLLFPRFEIGFSYDPLENLDFGDDTAGYYPKVAIGYRLPHVPVEIIERGNENCEAIESITTITDIAAQLKRRWMNPVSPNYSVILWNPLGSESMRRKMMIWAEDQCDDEIEAIELYSKRSEVMSRHDEIAKEGMESNVLLDESMYFASLLGENSSGMDMKSTNTFYALILRPDGHIADIKSFLS